MEEETRKLNEKWEMHSVIQQAIKTAHQEPSPETRRRLQTLEDNQNKFMDKLDNLGSKIENLSIDIAKMPEIILEKADARYASKTSEKVVYGMVGAIVLGVLYAILELVIKR